MKKLTFWIISLFLISSGAAFSQTSDNLSDGDFPQTAGISSDSNISLQNVEPADVNADNKTSFQNVDSTNNSATAKNSENTASDASHELETDFSSVKNEINYLIRKDLFINQDLISELSAQLSEEDKNELYSQNESNASKAMKENFFSGYGRGSAAQGNFAAFIPHLIIDKAGTYILAIGGGLAGGLFCVDCIVNLFAGMGAAAAGAEGKIFSIFPKGYIYSGLVALTGFGVCLTSRLISLIWPKIYANKFNAALKNALNLNEKVENISFEPLLLPSKNTEIGLLLSIKLN